MIEDRGPPFKVTTQPLWGRVAPTCGTRFSASTSAYPPIAGVAPRSSRRHNGRQADISAQRELVQKDTTPRAPFVLRDQIAASTFAALRIDRGV